MNLEKNTKIGELTQKYPKVRNFLKSLSEEYKNLDNEELFEMIKDITTLEMIAIKGSFEFEDLKEKIENFINA
ncbi:DUF1858 domain-containing protein [Parvimonas parva]|uniref:DUF1858 domain-containing protein n=1 Tax=Parvimonas parva TaxID=2769485 RepID=A0ABS1C6V0_9FIRM|nr:DUF1858 domain-containing protein [Parvimonas parva]MBK1467817.1 DUF1858 domain-containing protein [Parvimonas parva]